MILDAKDCLGDRLLHPYAASFRQVRSTHLCSDSLHWQRRPISVMNVPSPVVDRRELVAVKEEYLRR
jgi:hypothetical protein